MNLDLYTCDTYSAREFHAVGPILIKNWPALIFLKFKD